MTAIDGKLQAKRTWGDSPTGIGSMEGLEPGTRAFFERSLAWRSQVEQPWLREVAPFDQWAGKGVLEVGFGPGYDALAIMQAGALYTGVDITPENIVRTRQHLSFYDLEPDVQEGDAEALAFPDSSFDIVYSNGVLHHCPDINKTFSEAARVLKPGGLFYAVLYHRNSLFYWITLGFWHQIVHGGWRRQSLKDRVRQIEQNRVGALPIVNTYSRSEVSNLLRSAGLSPKGLMVRKLGPLDLPQIWLIHRFFRFIPDALYRAAGKRWGWYICAVAAKP